MSKPTEPNGAEDLRTDIAETRADLRDTVDELSTRLDVKTQTKRRVQRVKALAADAATQLKRSPAESLRSAARRAKPYTKQIVAGTSAAALALVVIRIRRAA
jgi:hypothetical protein